MGQLVKSMKKSPLYDDFWTLNVDPGNGIDSSQIVNKGKAAPPPPPSKAAKKGASAQHTPANNTYEFILNLQPFFMEWHVPYDEGAHRMTLCCMCVSAVRLSVFPPRVH